MREKLRNFHASKNDNRTDERVKYVTGKFVSEAKQLSDEHELPRPLKYYIELFKTAFVFLAQDQYNVDLLNEQYVTFSEKLLEFFAKTHKDENFGGNTNFFFSPILDVQEDIKYG